jgi:hypothetical protein
MKHFLFAAAAVSLAAVASIPAYAGESNSDPFPAAGAPITTGGVLANGGDGIVQSENSLPPGFEDGTAVQQYALSVNRYFAQQANQANQTAQVPTVLTRR